MPTILSAVKAILRPLRNLYYRFFPRLRHALTGRRRILLYANNPAMEAHIQRYAEPLLSDPSYQFYLCDPNFPAENDPKHVFQQFIFQNRIPRVMHPGRYAWDLIVCADMRTPASFTRHMTPLLYVNHGLHLISMDNGETLYGYGGYAWGEDGKPKFTAMCEPNALIAEEMQKTCPKMGAVIHHVGYKFWADVEAAQSRREVFRRELGVSSDTCLVGLFGSWRENSLFHALGMPIFDACASLRDEGFQFLFSIHPNEYSRYDEHLEPMGEAVEAQQERGMLVRNPKEDFAPYMAACDIIISDFSSMAESAMLFEKKLAFSPYPDGMVWKHSLTAKAREVLPTLHNADELQGLLHALCAAPLNPFIPSARAQLFCPDHDERMATLTRKLIAERRCRP